MNYRRPVIALLLGAIGLIALAGCTKKILDPRQNQRPRIELTRAPYNESTRFEYSYRMNWLGYDPDGRVDHYLYAIDPPAPTALKPEPETTWVQTDRSERLIEFSATQIDDSRPGVHGASDFHTFVVKAIDNGGVGGALQSAPLIRSFFTYTVAPTVQIQNPVPHDGYRAYVTPAVRINWTGTDDDGISDNKKPVKYKYILLTSSTEVTFQTAATSPDSVRIHYAPLNWAGWDSTTAETTEVLFTNLGIQKDYMFCVVAFDEAGAYSPVFSQNSNMLNMRVTFAAQGGPLITIFNNFFFYHFAHGSYSAREQDRIPIEVPAGIGIPFHWSAEIPPESGATLRGFRWALDIENLDDPTPRSNENTDWKHWSQESGSIASAQVGPFGGNEIHFFYLEAIDNNDLKSLAVVQITTVQSDLSKDLLVVNDTRRPVDGRALGVSCTTTPRGQGPWPSAAELDTFLFARGGVPWRCYPPGTTTRPGLFSEYSFDTLGTRTGTAEVRVPLSKLGHYRHVVWITDNKGAQYADKGTNLATSITALRYMSSAGRANSLSAYLLQGGQVWLLGGGIGYASTWPYNSTHNDDNLTGPAFTSDPHELLPSDQIELAGGRFMYDVPHWQSRFRSFASVLTMNRYLGRFEAGSNTVPPQYRNLPSSLRFRSVALGDSLPPERNNNDYFPFTPLVDVEYLSKRNDIVEDLDPSLGIDLESTMDSLYYARGSNLVDTLSNKYDVCMTVYHGPAYPQPIIFTGFNLWSWTKSDGVAMVHAVLDDMWGVPRAAPRPGPSAAIRVRSQVKPAATPEGRAVAIPLIHIGRMPDR